MFFFSLSFVRTAHVKHVRALVNLGNMTSMLRETDVSEKERLRERLCGAEEEEGRAWDGGKEGRAVFRLV